MTSPSKEISLKYLQETIKLAQQSPPKPTNFRVGCVIVTFHESSDPQVISTGYTLELPGNTHAEQCALSKLAEKHSVSEEAISEILSPELNTVLYTSLEPCGKRLSGNLPCVQRIIATRRKNPAAGIKKVVFGAKEPGTFVQDSQSCKLLTEAGIPWEYLPEFEEEILRVAMEGHQKGPESSTEKSGTERREGNDPSQMGTDANAAPNLPERNEATQPRNPKKRMMEAPPGSEASQS